MKVLVVNAGSSSLKYQLFDTETYSVLAKGLCERIGIGGHLKHTAITLGKKYEADIEMPNHSVATKIVVDTLTGAEYGCIKSMDEIEAVGHRIVHGGDFFSESVLVTTEVMAKLEQCRDLAPLHTGAHIQGIEGCLAVMPNTPQILVFDTAFHTTMPDYAKYYAVPYKMIDEYKIRRYGAHGTSHRYVSGEMTKILGKVEGTKIVTCHLGNGSSISAVKDGKVIDTSMGFTPLAGVEMGSRCGDMDPAVVPYLMKKTGMNEDEINEFMNKKCGILGISEVSSDFRDILAEIDNNGPKAAQCKLAYNILIYGIKKYIGAYTAAMNGLDAIVFTAGIGENTTRLRKDVCSDMEFFGIKVDDDRNENKAGVSGTRKISADDSKVEVYMIPTDEELVIAKDAERIVLASK